MINLSEKQTNNKIQLHCKCKSLNKEVSTSVQIHPPKSEAQNKSSKHRFFTFADVSESRYA